MQEAVHKIKCLKSNFVDVAVKTWSPERLDSLHTQRHLLRCLTTYCPQTGAKTDPGAVTQYVCRKGKEKSSWKGTFTLTWYVISQKQLWNVWNCNDRFNLTKFNAEEAQREFRTWTRLSQPVFTTLMIIFLQFLKMSLKMSKDVWKELWT